MLQTQTLIYVQFYSTQCPEFIKILCLSTRAIFSDPSPQTRKMSHKIIDRTKTHFIISIIEARNLRNTDKGSLSDPYVIVKVNGQKAYKTEHMRDTLDPNWSEKLYVGTTLKGASTPITKELMAESELEFTMFDKDKFSADDFMGMVTVSGNEVVEGFDKWIPLKDSSKHKSKGPAQGEIHLKAVYVEK
eukprot:TRINITY_DN9018_c0_g1_i1.p1 TRINITY_DN9018_c0_g1~~TRINITY_DN9018_c0_g1_i1.p1  ORF type:complete len:189 (+),score=22.53 TRINITY_DN9018_c0_g1_i1:74-640(+)